MGEAAAEPPPEGKAEPRFLGKLERGFEGGFGESVGFGAFEPPSAAAGFDAFDPPEPPAPPPEVVLPGATMVVASAAVPTTVELASLPAVAAMAVPAPTGAQPSFHPEPAAAAYTPALPSGGGGGGVDKEVWDCPACTFRNEVPRGPFQMSARCARRRTSP